MRHTTLLQPQQRLLRMGVARAESFGDHRGFMMDAAAAAAVAGVAEGGGAGMGGGEAAGAADLEGMVQSLQVRMGRMGRMGCMAHRPPMRACVRQAIVLFSMPSAAVYTCASSCCMPAYITPPHTPSHPPQTPLHCS